MRRGAARMLAIGALLAGCAPSAASPSPSVSAPSAPAASPLSMAPAISEPVVSHASLNADYVMGAAAVHVDGVSHLWVVAFGSDGDAPPEIRHLTSLDGLTWVPSEEPIELDATVLGLNEIGPVPSSVLVDVGGSWLLYGGGRLAETDAPVVWRATAPAPDGPWTMHPEPVLTPSADGWDSAITDHPSVLRTDDGYLMAYGGASGAQPNRNRIGIARSDDGITWTRETATLPEADDAEALGPTACGIDGRTMFESDLMQLDDGFRMLFGVIVDDDMFIGAADSVDGRTWDCAADGPLLAPTDFGGPGTGLHSYVVVRDDPAGTVLVEVLSDGASDLWAARPEGE